MKIAVVIPYYKEPLDIILRAYVSVAMQDTDDEVGVIFVADGYPREDIAKLNCYHLCLFNCGDYGDTPRAIGAIQAGKLGFDAVAFLDADNWYQPDHLSLMAHTMEREQADVVTCPRNLYREDVSFMRVDDESDGVAFNDTNCYLVGRRAFPLMSAWLFKDKSMSTIGDRIFWSAIRGSGLKIARSEEPTVNYVTTFAFHYQHNGEPVPPDSKVIVQIDGQFKTVSYTEFLELSKGQPWQA